MTFLQKLSLALTGFVVFAAFFGPLIIAMWMDTLRGCYE